MIEISATVGDESAGGAPPPLKEIEGAARAALEAEGVRDAELSIALLDDEEIARLNREHLGHEGPTDVISFALHQPGTPVIGDIYIGAEQAARQAAEAGVDRSEELLRLAIHGTLHVIGHDHPPGPERIASPMYLRQEEILASFLARRRG